MTLTQRIEALLEADKARTPGVYEAIPDGAQQRLIRVRTTLPIKDSGARGHIAHVTRHPGIATEQSYDNAKFIALSSQTPQLVRDILRVVAMQARALNYASAGNDNLVAHIASKALTESAPLVELAKRMEVV